MEGAPSQMAPLAAHLRREGFLTRSVHYATRTTLDVMARDVIRQVRAFGDPAGRLHVVGHSMGGILGRAVAAAFAGERFGRLVQIGAPNRGAGRIDWIPDLVLFRRRVARGYFELSPSSSRLADWPVPECEIGIIAGSKTFHPAVPGSWLVTAAQRFYKTDAEGPTDGCVSVEETRLEGAAHVVVPYAHDWMPREPVVHRHVESFLRSGEFDVSA